MERINEVLASGEGVLIGFMVIILLIVLFIALIVKIFEVIYTWKLFKKAGKGGWEALIPFYNKWVLVEISESNWWWFILLIISSFVSVTIDITENISEETSTLIVLAIISLALAVASLLATLVVSTNLAKKFDRSTGFGVLIALFPIIGIPIIAFGKDTYNFESEVPGNGIFGGEPVKKVKKPNVQSKCEKCEKTIDSSAKYCPYCGNKVK